VNFAKLPEGHGLSGVAADTAPEVVDGPDDESTRGDRHNPKGANRDTGKGEFHACTLRTKALTFS
jgi:hypothetical protein